MADNRGCSLGAEGLAFVTGGLAGPRWCCCWRRSRVVSHGSSCDSMCSAPKRLTMSWLTLPPRPWLSIIGLYTPTHLKLRKRGTHVDH